MSSIQIFLVEDQEIVRRGLKTLLNTKPDLEVVGEAENGVRAIAKLETLQQAKQLPNVVLMDIRMPEMDGVEATQQICQMYPEVKVLILTTFDDTEYVSQALQYGAKGYLLKDTPAEELAKAIRSIDQGHAQLGPGILEKVITNPSLAEPMQEEAAPPEQLQTLTPRERDVLRQLAKGASNREIAATLFLSEGTVRNHISNILSRLEVRDRTQAAIIANSFPTCIESPHDPAQAQDSA